LWDPHRENTGIKSVNSGALYGFRQDINAVFFHKSNIIKDKTGTGSVTTETVPVLRPACGKTGNNYVNYKYRFQQQYDDSTHFFTKLRDYN
jgi:hypothetical protein